MIKKFLFSIFIYIIFLAGSAFAYDAETPIRVGISNTNFSTYTFNTAEFYSDDVLEVTDSATGESVKISDSSVSVKYENNLFKIYRGQELKLSGLKGPITIKSGSLIGVSNLKRAGKPAFYRGIIELKPIENKNDYFAIVNILDLQNYLKFL